MENRIYNILKELVAIGSLTDSKMEVVAEEAIFGMLSKMDYFIDNSDLLGMLPIEGDPHGRKLVYALVKGETAKTVVLLSHHDVVGIEDYGFLKHLAFDIEELENEIGKLDLNLDAKADLESGEWIFGRGTADMKAGLAIELAIIEEYSKNPDKGSLLLLSVPDEESYSVGMRNASSFLCDLMEKYGLEYKLCINTEPNRREDGKHIVPIGTGGKSLPVVLCQGEKAHVGMCFDGINSLGIMSEIFRNTELNPEFSDEYMGEATMPPAWLYYKDQKNEYDVSLPLRTSGYISILSFSTTADEVITKLKAIAEQSFSDYVERVKVFQREYQRKLKRPGTAVLDYEAWVITFNELVIYCRENIGEDFEKLYENILSEAGKSIASGEANFPQATIEIMNRVLDISKITKPVVIVGFAPPYYPAASSRKVPGRYGAIESYFDFLDTISKDKFDIGLIAEEYTVALSDCSYCMIDKSFDFESFAKNTPMWGKLYNIAFKKIEQINMVSIIMGPWGKDYHQVTERVYKADVFERIPYLINELCKKAFKED